MARHFKILEYALSSLLRRKYKNLAIVVIYSFIITVLASILFLTHSLKTEASLVLQNAPQLLVQRIVAGRHDLISAKYMETIREIPGVGDVKPRYWGYYYDALTKSNYTLQGVGSSQSDLKMLDGRLPSQAGECAIGSGVANAQITGVGGELILIDSQGIGAIFEITGVFQAASNILTNDLVILTEEELIRFFGFPADMATDISVQVYNENEVANIAAKIKKFLPDVRPITRNEIIRTYDTVFNWRSGIMLTIFASALISFCILAWDKATGISGEEKREIGILKAIGWDTADILELKFWEGFAISVTALLLGLIAAFCHVFYFNASIIAPVIKGWSVLFPDFQFTPYVDLYQIFVIGFLTVTPYVASTVIPSWKTAITDPENIMRS